MVEIQVNIMPYDVHRRIQFGRYQRGDLFRLTVLAGLSY